MKLLNELKQAQADKDYKRVNELRLALDQEANTMGIITVQGISGLQLFHWQGAIGYPPSAIKVKGKWYMLDGNDPRIHKVNLTPPTNNQHGLLVLIGKLYHQKHALQLITIDDLKELMLAA